MFQIYFTKI